MRELDLFEPLRRRLEALGWKMVYRWTVIHWIRPDGAELDEREAFAQLQRIDSQAVQGDDRG
jgi:hypothetical protein